jgi:hypothetical protein
MLYDDIISWQEGNFMIHKNLTLEMWLFVTKTSQKEFAKLIDKTPVQVSNIIRRGGTCKRESTALKIEEATKGRVSRYTIYPDLRRLEKKREKEARKTGALK